jgi:hypothetical protein
MFGLLELRHTLQRVVRVLDGDALDAATAEQLVEEFATIEHLAAAGKALAAKRVADSGRWRLAGERSEADWLAKRTGETVGAARAALETAAKLADCPSTAEAFRKGELSVPQANAIAAAAAADPTAEQRLLDLASSAGLKRLRESCDRVLAAASDSESTHDRVHRGRYWRRWTDADGGRCGQYKLTVEAAAVLEAAAEPFVEQAFRAARGARRHEPSEAYAADGLVGLAAAVRSGEIAAPT